jgi:outer membrane protein assembly factor BamD
MFFSTILKRLSGAVILCFVLIIAFSCDPCRRLSKSNLLELKDSAAFCYYKRKNFETASVMFEELKALYRADVRLERVAFHYAYTKYYMGQNIMAAYYFREFAQMFPAGKYTEEANYMVGKAYSMTANEYPLDQTETVKAIEYLQLYITQYPIGQWIDPAKQMLKTMKERLAKKAFHQANLYFKISQYHSGIIAFKNMLADYPDSEFREEAQYKLFMCAVLYAQHSIPQKQEERFLEAKGYYEKFVDQYPKSKFLGDAEKQYNKTETEVNKIKTGKKAKR